MNSFLITLLKNPLGLIAAATPFIVKSIDDNRAKLDAAAKLLDSEIKTATDLAMEVTSALDRVIHLNQEAVFGIVFRRLNIRTIKKLGPLEPDRKAWETYHAEQSLWNSSRTTRLVRVSSTFNSDTVRLYSGLSKQIELLENMANAAFFDRRQSRFFINDTRKPRCPGKVDFLIDLLRIDPQELPGLVDTIKEFSISAKDTPRVVRPDFRCKYIPIYQNCQKELMEIGTLMLGQIQAQQVGTLR
ncbi:MAG TPA: hypothetical protein VKV15_17040 [Bryobacteraceae bacterium]|nr:hypothetical protein [Bryobacteraceae bacterium]